MEVVQKTLNYIGEALANGHKVELRNFGVFEVKVRLPAHRAQSSRADGHCRHPDAVGRQLQAGQRDAGGGPEAPP